MLAKKDNLNGKYMKKKSLILLITVLIYSMIIIGSTYAYLYGTAVDDNTITGNLSSADVVLNVDKIVPTNDLTLVPLLDDALSNAIKGTGGINSCIDSLGNLSCEIYKITISNTGNTNLALMSTINLVAGSNYTDYYENLKWRELSDATTVKTDSIINEMDTATLDASLNLGIGQTKSYYIAVWISETGADQVEKDYGKYVGIVKFFLRDGPGVTAIFGETPNLFTEEVQSLYSDGSDIETVTIGTDTTTYAASPLVRTATPQVFLNHLRGIMLDNNGHYRYYGASPNNYIYFNCDDYANQSADTCELWRIIGVFNDVDDGTGNLETRVKIIRDEEIGSYPYDTSSSSINSGQGTNDWSKSDLMHLLNSGYETEAINNSLYWNRGAGSCYSERYDAYKDCDFSEIGITNASKEMIGDAKFYLGSFSDTETALMNSGEYVEFMEQFYPHQMYNFERSTNVYDCSVDDGACPRATEWVGKIGLMYPSDYIYATDLSVCKENGIAFGWSDWNHQNLVHSKCYENDWLHTEDSYIEWLISPHNTPRYRPFTLQNGKYIFGAYSYHSYEVRPTLYLKSDVLILTGNGTKNYPYQLYNSN